MGPLRQARSTMEIGHYGFIALIQARPTMTLWVPWDRPLWVHLHWDWLGPLWVPWSLGTGYAHYGSIWTG